jgi:hypothetical protein
MNISTRLVIFPACGVVESVPLGLLANMKRLPSFALDLVRYLIADQQGDEQAC